MGWLIFILLIIGGLNWGLVGAFDYDLITSIFGEAGTITQIIYILIGLAAVYELFTKWGAKK